MKVKDPLLRLRKFDRMKVRDFAKEAYVYPKRFDKKITGIY